MQYCNGEHLLLFYGPLHLLLFDGPLQSAVRVAMECRWLDPGLETIINMIQKRYPLASQCVIHTGCISGWAYLIHVPVRAHHDRLYLLDPNIDPVANCPKIQELDQVIGWTAIRLCLVILTCPMTLTAPFVFITSIYYIYIYESFIKWAQND